MTDYKTAGSLGIWSILTGITLFASTFRIRNRVKFLNSLKWPEEKKGDPASYPQAKLRISGGNLAGLNARGLMPTVGNLAAGATCDFATEISATYELTLTYDSLDEVLPDQIDTAITAAFLLAGANLGIAKVKTWGPITMRSEQKKTETAAGTLRLVQTYTIPLTFRLHRADVVGA